MQVAKVNHMVDSIWQIADTNRKSRKAMDPASVMGTYVDPGLAK